MRGGIKTPNLRCQHDGRHLRSDRLAGNVQEVLMVREKQHLGLLRQFTQHFEARGSTIIVEIDKQIVGDEG
jgi:hypothetical protein